jgi:hypothetical protein
MPRDNDTLPVNGPGWRPGGRFTRDVARIGKNGTDASTDGKTGSGMDVPTRDRASLWRTRGADNTAEALGIGALTSDWHDAVLSIIACVAGDPSTAEFAGPGFTKDREIWWVVLRGRGLRVVYQPDIAKIIAVHTGSFKPW